MIESAVEIAPLLTAISSIGFTGWHSFHMTTKVGPDQAKAHLTAIQVLTAQHIAAINLLTEQHIAAIIRLTDAHKEIVDRLIDELSAKRVFAQDNLYKNGK